MGKQNFQLTGFKGKLPACGLVAALLATGCGTAIGLNQGNLGARLSAKGTVPAPDLVTILSPNQSSRGGGGIDTVVLHHTSSAATARGIAGFFSQPSAKVSSHYVVDRSGELVRCVPDKDRAWHAGVSSFKGRSNVNVFSIGIEICNVGDNKEPYPTAQVQSTIRLVAWLLQAYDIPMSRITRHKDVALPAGRKDDTSAIFPLEYFNKGVQAVLAGQPIPPREDPVTPAGYDRNAAQSYTVQAGDTWEPIADEQLDAASRGEELRPCNPGATLRPGTRIQLPMEFSGFYRLQPPSGLSLLG